MKDDREEVLAHANDVAYLKNHPEIQDHALVKFILVEKPNLPEELFKLLAHQYAKIIHVNAYRSFFKFDLTFVDDSTSRISIPISVVWIFVEQLEDALKAMRATSKPG